MPWLTPPNGGFFVRRVVRGGQNSSPRDNTENATKRSTREYVFEARIDYQDPHYRINVLKWPRPDDPNIALDGMHTNLLNDSIIWIDDAFAPRTAESAIEWFEKWIECLLGYYDGDGPFTFPRNPNVY